MPFPVSPTDGQTTNINGKVYVYSASDDKWQVQALYSATGLNALTVSGPVISETLDAQTVRAGTIGNTGATLVGNVNGSLWGPHNGTVGATIANTGAFTTVTASSTLDVTGTANFAATVNAATLQASTIGNTGATIIGTHNGPVNGPHNGTVGATTPNTGAFTTLTTSGNVTVGGNLDVTSNITVGNASITGNLVVGNLSGRITPRVSSTASITSPLAWNSNNFDQYVATAQAANLTINADAGSPIDGQKILFRFKDNGTSRTLTWTTATTNAFRVIGVTLPTATTISKVTYVGCIYNAADSRWDVIAVATEA